MDLFKLKISISLVTVAVGVALCDYDCVCNYDYAPKAPSPFPQENNNKNVGLVQVFECRPLINVTVDGKWAAVAINHTVGYMQLYSDWDDVQVKLHRCPGSPDSAVSDEKAEARPDVNIKVATFTVGEKSNNRTSSAAKQNQSTAGPLCFAGRGHTLVDNTLIKRCQPDEVCFIAKVTNRKFSTTHWSAGCVKSKFCTQSGTGPTGGSNTSSPCLQCCSSNYCNLDGCGNTGFKERRQRGPICYNCMTPTIEECNTYAECTQDNVCKLEMYGNDLDDRSYNFYCSDKQTCMQTNPEYEVPVCQYCCANDFCNNRNCSTSVLPPELATAGMYNLSLE